MNTRKFSVTGIVAVLTLSLPTAGQQLIQDGRALDANPLRGSGGFNPTGRPYDPNASNRIVTGNVVGGRAFQGYSPIRDSGSLFLGSPNYSGYGITSSGALRSRSGYASGYAADTLSSFYRDSYSYGDNRDPYTPAWQSGTYYSPSAYSAGYGGYSQGLNRIGPSQAGQPYAYTRSGRLPGATLSDPLVAARHSLQGGSVSARLPDLYQTSAGRVPADQLVQQANQDQAMAAGAGPRPLTGLVDTRVKAPGPEDPRRVDNRHYAPGAPPARVDSMEAILERGRHLESRLSTPLNRPLTEPQGERPRSIPHQAAPGGLEAGPEASESVEPTLPELSIPLATTPESTFNLRMSQATKSLKDARYYEAASQFEIAQMMAGQNPLPLLGRSMALLGAGDYMSSASVLFQAMRMLDEQRDRKVDTLAFARDVTNLNDRIIELRSRLQGNDDYRLRFLLGYAEYAVGLTDLGMGHLERAIAIRTKELAEGQAPAKPESTVATKPADSSQTANPELQCMVRLADRLKTGDLSPAGKPATRPAGT